LTLPDPVKPPEYTTPLTKLIRTFEGWLVIVCVAALVIVPIITKALPVELAAKLGTGLAGVTVTARSILKLFATKNWGQEDFLATKGGSDAVATVPPSNVAAIAQQPDTEEFDQLPTEVTPLPVDPAPVAEVPAVPPYDWSSDPGYGEPQGADTPESRGEDPTL